MKSRTRFLIAIGGFAFVSISVLTQDLTHANSKLLSSDRSQPAVGSRSGNLLLSGCDITGAVWTRQVVHQLERAWILSQNGTSHSESVVLLYRMHDGSYVARCQGYTNQRYRFTFAWDTGAKAIIHVHPNNRDPWPEDSDMRLADKLNVPIFTITISGMFAYDPTTRERVKVRDLLDWLKPCEEAGRTTGSVPTGGNL